TNSNRATGIGAALVIVGAMLPLLLQPSTGPVFPLPGQEGHLMQASPYTNVAIILLLGISLLCLPLVAPYFNRLTTLDAVSAHKPEIYVLLTLSLTGMVAFITSAHLLTLYVALELMSFPLYILASIVRDDAKSSESGLKYYVLGSMASGLMLYGISLLYAGLGTLSFSGIFTALNTYAETPVILIGVTLTLLGTLFKLSVVPFHMWTPDVYEGAPTPVTAIMGALPKVAAFVVLVRLLSGPFVALDDFWQPALAWLAVASMVAGSAMAIVQTSLKRLLAYSTIANVGFVMVGVVSANALGASGTLTYITIYAVTTLGLFSAVMASGLNTVDDLKGLATRSKWLAATFMVLLFSLAGIPPLAGFMAKLGVFSAAVAAGLNYLAVAGVLASVIALFYSLWLIKIMYFDAPLRTAALPTVRTGYAVIMLVAVMASFMLGILPTLVSTYTLAAATAIF
ncbi:MAG: NADH-quinone oxidoreductase subunit N, partial [Verrucomicrobiaceae bacterium]